MTKTRQEQQVIIGLDHVQLTMPRGKEADASAYYGDLLGLVRLDKPDQLQGRGGVWFALPDGRQLHLGVLVLDDLADGELFRPHKKAHPAFLVGSADQLTQLAHRLERDGYPVKWDDALAPIRRFYSEDVFGNRLEFMYKPVMLS